MKNYQERVGDRWLHGASGSWIEVAKVTETHHQIVSSTGDRSDHWYRNTAENPGAWDSFEYVGNFAKSENVQSLYQKLNEENR